MLVSLWENLCSVIEGKEREELISVGTDGWSEHRKLRIKIILLIAE